MNGSNARTQAKRIQVALALLGAVTALLASQSLSDADGYAAGGAETALLVAADAS
ncbi:MAG: hypothetical protein ACK40O_13085 [Allosphingosinicella sp.]